jgi:hypothetical protein
MFSVDDIQQFTLNDSDGQAYALLDSLIVFLRASPSNDVQHPRQLGDCLESVIPGLDGNVPFKHEARNSVCPKTTWHTSGAIPDT